MWTLWGNVYTPRDDGGSDIAREPTGRDLSGHGTWSQKGPRCPLGPPTSFFSLFTTPFNPKIFAATRRQGCGWLRIGLAN